MGLLAATVLAAKLWCTPATLPEQTGTAEPPEKSRITLGYNALESAVTAESELKYRLLSNVDINLGNYVAGWHGSSDITLPGEDLFLRNTFMIGGKNSKQQLAFVTKADGYGIFDRKLGIRDTSLQEKLGFYGWTDVVFDRDAANVTMLWGKQFGNFSFEWFPVAEIPYEGRRNLYLELQGNYKVANGLNIFGRAELPEMTPVGGRYMVGFTVTDLFGK